MPISTYLANALLNHVFKRAAFTQPTNLYVALSRANPTNDGSGIDEPTGNGYARKLWNAWIDAANREIANNGVFEFDPASGSWGTITYVALYDAPSGGNMLAYGTVPAKAYEADDVARFPNGALKLTVT